MKTKIDCTRQLPSKILQQAYRKKRNQLQPQPGPRALSLLQTLHAAPAWLDGDRQPLKPGPQRSTGIAEGSNCYLNASPSVGVEPPIDSGSYGCYPLFKEYGPLQQLLSPYTRLQLRIIIKLHSTMVWHYFNSCIILDPIHPCLSEVRILPQHYYIIRIIGICIIKLLLSSIICAVD